MDEEASLVLCFRPFIMERFYRGKDESFESFLREETISHRRFR
jgi:hypothetical protein